MGRTKTCTAMIFTEQIRARIIRAYVILFYLLAAYKWVSGMWLYQHDPFIFKTRFDGTTWLFMQTRIHQYLLHQEGGFLLMDILFYSIPVIYYKVYRRAPGQIMLAGFIMLLVNWFYVQNFTLYPTNSIEGNVGWLLFPFLLMTKGLRSSYYVFHGLLYFFLYFFVSAGLWKMCEGGLFNIGEMSHLLLFQHEEQPVSSPDHWYTCFIYWLVKNPGISYILYLLATLMELAFITGFFTRKFDRWLIRIFLVFIVADIIIMKINYFEVLPFLLTLYYSKYELPANKTA
jgi:hypothetical protein